MTIETPEWVKRAKAGDKVVCVKKSEATRGVEPGNVYTISAVLQGYDYAGNPNVGFTLVEAKPPLSRYDGYLWFLFKPLETRKTDISIFTEMLKTKELEEC